MTGSRGREPGVVPAGTAAQLRRIGGLFVPQRAALALMLMIIVIISAVGTVSPFLLRAVIDTALPRRDIVLLYQLGAGLVAVAGLAAVLSLLQGWISTRIGLRIMHRLRTEVFAHLQRQSLTFFTRTRAGEVRSRIANDIGGLQDIVISVAASAASQLTMAVSVTVTMAALSWQLTLVSLVVMAPAVAVTRKAAALRRKIVGRRRLEFEDMTVMVEESLSVNGIQLSKTLGTGPAQTARFTEISSHLADLELHSRLAGRWRMASLSLLFAAIPAAIYIGAGYRSITIGTVVAFTGLQSALFQHVLGRHAHQPHRPQRPVRRLHHMTSAESPGQRRQLISMPSSMGKVTLLYPLAGSRTWSR